MNEIVGPCEEDMRQILSSAECKCGRPKRSGLPICPFCFSKLDYPDDDSLKGSVQLIRDNYDEECWSILSLAYCLALISLESKAA